MLRDIQNILQQDSVRLTESLPLTPDSARIEVQCLMQQALNVTRAYLLAYPERCLDESEQAHYDELLQRRLRGEPVAYLLGEREFFGLSFKVTPATLIPRPETELLVELALQYIPSPPDPLPLAGEGGRQAGRGKFRVLDLGTGCGAIALAIAHARPDTEVIACDISTAALDVACENALKLSVANVAFVHSDWFQSLSEKHFSMVVANPPYVAADDPHLTQGDVRFEPQFALTPGDDGLSAIRHIVSQAQKHLQPGGWLLLEHGYDQAAQVRELLRQHGFGEVFSARDLAGIERVTGGRG